MPKIPVKISNIKISTSLKSISPTKLKSLCEDEDVEYKEHSNFIIFKLIDENPCDDCAKKTENCAHTYTIFKPNSKSQKKVHVNICGIKENQIDESIKKLRKFLDQNFLEYHLERIPYKIDTITGTAKLGHKIILRKFLEKNQNEAGNKVKYNPEAFPSVFLTRDNITYAIFSTGSINIIGAKSREDIESKIDYVIEKCMECTSKNESHE